MQYEISWHVQYVCIHCHFAPFIHPEVYGVCGSHLIQLEFLKSHFSLRERRGSLLTLQVTAVPSQ